MSAPLRPTMTPERWQAVDQILQRALVCAREDRDAFVAGSCGQDTALRSEVSSLLAVYDATPADFLERPAIEEHDVSSSATPELSSLPTVASPPTRTVSARVAVYAAAAAVLWGAVMGWSLAHSATVDRWRSTWTAIRQQANANAASRTSTAPSAATGATGDLSLAVVDRSGRVVREIAANRPATPRFTPDGRRVAYGAFGEGRNTSDLWITDVDDGTTRRFTNDDADNQHPQWSPETEPTRRVSPHRHWVAYTSNESGRDEVYVDSYPRPGYRALVSQEGGVDPVWRGDGRELYYWHGDALVAVPIDGSRGDRPAILGAERVLFHAPYEHTASSMYDVSPNGQLIAIVRRR